MRRPRKSYTPTEKVAILRRHLIDRVPISDLCDEYHLPPSIFYAWQKLFFENGQAAFTGNDKRRKADTDAKDRQSADLQAKLQRKHEVLSELMEEHVQLNKARGEL